MSGILYIVATPIGNLEDITHRAVKTLTEVDFIIAEDTRVSKKLIDHIEQNGNQVKASLLSYHQHSPEEKKLEILKHLMDGKTIALVTDAGTPGVSDPGNELIDFLLSYQPELKVIPIPGASAVTSALSVSGFDTSKFLFLGFWPKKKLGKLIQLIKTAKLNFVFYESPFRIIKTLLFLEKEFGADLRILVARELTKMHETLYRGGVREVRERLGKERIRGEIVVIVEIR